MHEENPILKSYALFGILFTFITSMFLRHVYELTNYSSFFGYFVPVNNSMWEQLKLAFYAWLLYGIVNSFLLIDQSNNYWLGIFSAMMVHNLFLIISYYSYTGMMGSSIDFLNIALYLMGCILAAYTFYKVLTAAPLPFFLESVCLLIILLVACVFMFVTYSPPNLPLFKEATETTIIHTYTTPISLSFFDSSNLTILFD